MYGLTDVAAMGLYLRCVPVSDTRVVEKQTYLKMGNRMSQAESRGVASFTDSLP